jgi:hypothetical protein
MGISSTNTRTITPSWLKSMGQSYTDEKKNAALMRYNWGAKAAAATTESTPSYSLGSSGDYTTVSPSWDSATADTPNSVASKAATDRLSNSLYGGLSDIATNAGMNAAVYSGIASMMGSFSPSTAVDVARSALNPVSTAPGLIGNALSSAMGLDTNTTTNNAVKSIMGILSAINPGLGIIGTMLSPQISEAYGALTGTRANEEAKQSLADMTGKGIFGVASDYAAMDSAAKSANELSNMGSYTNTTADQDKDISAAHNVNVAKELSAFTQQNPTYTQSLRYGGLLSDEDPTMARDMSYSSPEVQESMATLLGINTTPVISGNQSIAMGLTPAADQGYSHYGSTLSNDIGYGLGSTDSSDMSSSEAADVSTAQANGWGMGMTGRMGDYSGIDNDREASAAAVAGALSAVTSMGSSYGGGGGLGTTSAADASATSSGASNDGSSAASRAARGYGIGRDSGLGGLSGASASSTSGGSDSGSSSGGDGGGSSGGGDGGGGSSGGGGGD